MVLLIVGPTASLVEHQMSQVVAGLSWYPSNNSVQTSAETNDSINNHLSSGFAQIPDSSSYYVANNENDRIQNNNAKSLFPQFQQKSFNDRQAMPTGFTGGMVILLPLLERLMFVSISEPVYASITNTRTTRRLDGQPEQFWIWTTATNGTESTYATASGLFGTRI